MTEAADAVPLSLEAVRVLASKPRFEILRKLHERRMTAAEIGDALAMSRGKAHAHLVELARAGFAQREGDERVWVYYSLTPTGERLVQSPRPRIVILFASAAASAIVAAAFLALRAWLLSRPTGGVGSGPLPPNRPPDLSAPQFEWMLLSGLILALGATFATALALSELYGRLRSKGVGRRGTRRG